MSLFNLKEMGEKNNKNGDSLIERKKKREKCICLLLLL